MANEPLVSVIIPAFNAQDYIAETLDSIITQTYKNLEIIVIDDGSTDRTRAIVAKYKPVVDYHYRENSGGSAIPKNDGIRLSTGDYLCFMDADDLLIEDSIGTRLDFMERHRDVGMSFMDYRNFDENGQHTETHFKSCTLLGKILDNHREIIIDNPCWYLAQENFGINGTLMVCRELLLKETEFDQRLRNGEDYHLYYRLSRHTRVGVINKTGMLRRLHASNKSSNTATRLPADIIKFSSLIDGEQDAEIRWILKQRLANILSFNARHNANNGNYLRALNYECKSLITSFSYARLLKSARSILRIAAIASGLHKPREG